MSAVIAKLVEKLELKEHTEKIFPAVWTGTNGMGIYAKLLSIRLC